MRNQSRNFFNLRDFAATKSRFVLFYDELKIIWQMV